MHITTKITNLLLLDYFLAQLYQTTWRFLFSNVYLMCYKNILRGYEAFLAIEPGENYCKA